MPTVYARRHTSRFWSLLRGATIFAALGGGALATLWALDFPLPWAQPVARRPVGVPVPLSNRAIPAYSRVSRNDLINLADGSPIVVYLSEEQVKAAGFVTDFGAITGRVLSRDKPAGFAFSESDFFPRGTRPGLVAGVPPGKRALVLEADKIKGVYGLQPGDRFDLLATMPVDAPPPLAGPLAVAPPPFDPTLPKRAAVKVLVHHGAIVAPVTMRASPQPPSQQPPGTPAPRPSTRAQSVAEVTIAVAPEEVAPLLEALAVDADVLCVARSGHPDDPGELSITPGSQPVAPLRSIETIVERQRQTHRFPISQN